jgi:hypothetical protein
VQVSVCHFAIAAACISCIVQLWRTPLRWCVVPRRLYGHFLYFFAGFSKQIERLSARASFAAATEQENNMLTHESEK